MNASPTIWPSLLCPLTVALLPSCVCTQTRQDLNLISVRIYRSRILFRSFLFFFPLTLRNSVFLYLLDRLERLNSFTYFSFPSRTVSKIKCPPFSRLVCVKIVWSRHTNAVRLWWVVWVRLRSIVKKTRGGFEFPLLLVYFYDCCCCYYYYYSRDLWKRLFYPSDVAPSLSSTDYLFVFDFLFLKFTFFLFIFSLCLFCCWPPNGQQNQESFSLVITYSLSLVAEGKKREIPILFELSRPILRRSWAGSSLSFTYISFPPPKTPEPTAIFILFFT